MHVRTTCDEMLKMNCLIYLQTDMREAKWCIFDGRLNLLNLNISNFQPVFEIELVAVIILLQR